MKKTKSRWINYQISVSFDIPITKENSESDINVCVNHFQKELEEKFNNWKDDYSALKINNIKWNE